MLKKTLIVTLFNFLGFGLALLTNMIISSKFGAGYNLDCYIIALLVPNYIVSVLSIILSYTFIPIFTKYNLDNKNEAWKVANIFINIITIFLIILCVFLFVFSNNIIGLVSPGFKLEQQMYASELFRIYTPVIIFSALNELIASIFYSNNKFVTPLMNKIISPILTIFFVVFFSLSFNVKSLVLASLISVIIQFLILLIQLNKFPEFKFQFIFSINNPGVIMIFKLMAPLFLSTVFSKLFPVIDSSFLSTLDVGDISRINYANKIQLFIGSIISSVFSVQVFSLFSQLSAKGNMVELKNQVAIFIRFLLFVSIPFCMFTFLFSENIVKLFYERGSFNSNDTDAVSNFLRIYILALPSIAIGSIISQVLYAMKEMKSVLIIGFLEFIFYLTMCYLLMYLLKASAIPITYMINFNISVFALALIARKKINLGGGLFMIRSISKFFLLSLSSIFFIYMINNYLLKGEFVFLYLYPIGLLFYYFIATLLKFNETTIINEKLKQILSKFYKQNIPN